MPSEQGQHNIYDADTTFWKKYQKGRPRVPDSLFDRIFDYHAQHGGRFDTVHDAGAGPGVHSARLARRFEHVIVTDPSKENIRIARDRLPEDNTYDITVSKLEDTISLPPASVDLLFAGVCMHFTDLDKAIAAIAHQLKPGGTFFTGGWGLAWLDDPNPRLRAAWQKLFPAFNKQYMGLEGSPQWESINHGVGIAASGYDAIPVPEEYFQPGALRLKLNWPGTMEWHRGQVPAEYEDIMPFWSQAGPSDVAIRETESGWDFEMGIEELRGVIDSFPSIDLNSGPIAEMWQEVADIVGDKRVKGHWPAMLILATRK